jgi:PIN domain nuclease of toxin-antitoxin system
VGATTLDGVQLPDFDGRKGPADRFIAATARRHGTLLTRDESLLERKAPAAVSPLRVD